MPPVADLKPLAAMHVLAVEPTRWPPARQTEHGSVTAPPTTRRAWLVKTVIGIVLAVCIAGALVATIVLASHPGPTGGGA